MTTSTSSKTLGSISLGGALALCRGFGTCGWIGAGRPKSVQPLVAADVMPARVHAVRVRDYDRLRRARLTTLAALWNCFGPRADSGSRRQGPSSTPPWTRRRGRTRGLDSSRPGPLSRQPDASVDSIGCNLLLIRTFALKEVAGPNPGRPVMTQAPARERWPDRVGHSSLGEALNRPQDASH